MLQFATCPIAPGLEAIFSPLQHHLALQALLAGVVPGLILTDDEVQPSLALAWVQQRLFLAGPPDLARLRETLADQIEPEAKARHVRHLVLHVAPNAWSSLIETQLQFPRPSSAMRHYYEFRSARHNGQRPLPAGYALRAVDQTLLEEPGLQHVDLLLDEMCSERPSVASFLANSFGVCVVSGGALAGWCLSEYNHAAACEAGIETLPAYRRQGLGTAMATALVEQALARGVRTQLGWHCYAHNTASVATALAAGFEKVAEYPALVLDFEANT